jgi:hypothetical protein
MLEQLMFYLLLGEVKCLRWLMGVLVAQGYLDMTLARIGVEVFG